MAQPSPGFSLIKDSIVSADNVLFCLNKIDLAIRDKNREFFVKAKYYKRVLIYVNNV